MTNHYKALKAKVINLIRVHFNRLLVFPNEASFLIVKLAFLTGSFLLLLAIYIIVFAFPFTLDRLLGTVIWCNLPLVKHSKFLSHCHYGKYNILKMFKGKLSLGCTLASTLKRVI